MMRHSALEVATFEVIGFWSNTSFPAGTLPNLTTFISKIVHRDRIPFHICFSPYIPSQLTRFIGEINPSAIEIFASMIHVEDCMVFIDEPFVPDILAVAPRTIRYSTPLNQPTCREYLETRSRLLRSNQP